MSFRWREEVTLRFVREYLKREALWNVRSALYKNKRAKQAAYASLEKAMNIPGFTEREIKLKIKNIRSTYSQELKKIKDSKTSGCDADSVYVPSIKWFQLLDESLANASFGMRSSKSELISYSQNFKDESSVGEDSTMTELAYPTSDSVLSPPQSIIADSPCKKNKLKLKQIKTVLNQLKEQVSAVTAPPPVAENEFDVFGRSVGLQLQAMPLQIALESQQYIQTYLSRKRLQHLLEPSSPPPRSDFW